MFVVPMFWLSEGQPGFDLQAAKKPPEFRSYGPFARHRCHRWLSSITDMLRRNTRQDNFAASEHDVSYSLR
jgi:hypothetical protein